MVLYQLWLIEADCFVLQVGGLSPALLQWQMAIAGQSIGQCSASPCSSTSCSGHGDCVVVSDSQSSCNCHYGYTGTNCQTAVQITIPSFSQDSYAILKNKMKVAQETLITFEMKPIQLNGLILYNRQPNDFFGRF